MRTEVMVLSSNVQITANDDDTSKTMAYPYPFGCQVIVSDFFEPKDLTYRKGSIDFDNISLYRCSQEKTSYSSLRFDHAVQGVKRVTNSAIHTGRGNGILINKSRNVELTGNVIHDHVRWGIHGANSADMTIRGNIVNGITPYMDHTAFKTWEIYNGAVWFDGCQDFEVSDNIAASAWQVGFRLPSWPCGENPARPLGGNVAHSISGHGLIVIEAEKSTSCSQFKDFKGYKNQVADVQMGGSVSSHNVLTKVVSIDSNYGAMAFPSEDGELDLKDSTFYGGMNMENLDCP